MTKNNKEFQDFLRDHVNLNDTRLDRLRSGVRGVNGHLKEHLKGYQNMEPQGSYAFGTLIKPVDDNDEYDADIQIVMNPNSEWEPKDYVLEVRRTLAANKTYADKLRLKTRCVTVDYAGDFHLDVVPRVTIKGKHYVCNRNDNKFEQTDGVGYRDWINEKNRITGGNLKRVIRLLKYLRDHKNSFTAKSILLTTLIGNTIKASDEGEGSVSTNADTLVTVLTRMDNYLQQHPNMPKVKNPVLATEDFNRHWDQQKYANFRDRVHSYAQTARKAKDEPSSEKAIKLWQELFGDDFGKGSSGGGNGNSGGNGGGSGNSPGRPSGGQGSNRPLLTAPAAAPVRPRGPYAGAQIPEARVLEPVTITLSDEDVQRITLEQPGLSYDAKGCRIIGTLEFSAEFDKDSGWLTPLPEPTEPGNSKAIHDTFEIEIRLDFQPSAFNPWPPVIETGGRIQQIMEQRQIADIADMHCYPGLSENRCCLGIQAATGSKIEIVRFIRELVVPFFYRVAYVDRFGLAAAKDDLWKEYPHSPREAYRQYLGELQSMRKTGRNQPCPCGSGAKFKRCHLAEVEQGTSGTSYQK